MSQPMDIIAKKKQYPPKDPDYFKTYYQEKNKGLYIGCPQCGRPTSKVNLSKHMKRNVCLRRAVVNITLEIAERLGLDPYDPEEEEIDIPDLDPSRI